MEEEMFDFESSDEPYRYTVLVIYDIIDNKKRNKLYKYLSKYGKSIQYSSFEFKITNKLYNKLVENIKKIKIDENNKIKIYKFTNIVDIKTYGKDSSKFYPETIVI